MIYCFQDLFSRKEAFDLSEREKKNLVFEKGMYISLTSKKCLREIKHTKKTFEILVTPCFPIVFVGLKDLDKHLIERNVPKKEKKAKFAPCFGYKTKVTPKRVDFHKPTNMKNIPISYEMMEKEIEDQKLTDFFSNLFCWRRIYKEGYENTENEKNFKICENESITMFFYESEMLLVISFEYSVKTIKKTKKILEKRVRINGKRKKRVSLKRKLEEKEESREKQCKDFN